jgi:hypothetical protein
MKIKVFVSESAVQLRKSDEFDGLMFRKAVRLIPIEDSVHVHGISKGSTFLLANDDKGYGVVVLFGTSPWRFTVSETMYNRIVEKHSVPAYMPKIVAKLVENLRKNEHGVRVFNPKTAGAHATIFKLLLSKKDQASDYAIRIYVESSPYIHERMLIGKNTSMYVRTIEVPMSIKTAMKINPGRYSADIVRKQANGNQVVLRWDNVDPTTGDIGEYAWHPEVNAVAMVRREGWHPDIKSTINLD